MIPVQLTLNLPTRSQPAEVSHDSLASMSKPPPIDPQPPQNSLDTHMLSITYIIVYQLQASNILSLVKEIQKNVQFQWKTTTEVQVLRKHIAT